MASAEPPLDEREQRNFLAEILKVSSISPLDLLHFIREKDLSPHWTEMVLPYGRSASACMRAYDILTSASAEISAIDWPPGTAKVSPSVALPKKKRPAPEGGPFASPNREIQAQTFPSVNTPADHLPPRSGEPPQKKRGRPSKEEHERRVREAAQRGEVYPPPKKMKTPRHSLVEAAGAVPKGTGERSANKDTTKRPKGAFITADPAQEISRRRSSLEATANAADQMQIEIEEGIKRTILGPQASDFDAQERLLAGMREHAATVMRAEADTAQFDLTSNGESARRSEGDIITATPNLPTTTNES